MDICLVILPGFGSFVKCWRKQKSPVSLIGKKPSYEKLLKIDKNSASGY